MKHKGLVITGVLLVAVVGYIAWPEDVVRHPSGVLAPEEPDQRPVAESKHWQKDAYDIAPLAQFRVHALVLSRERYWLGREADLSPLDFALGWGPMSDQQIVDAFDIRQGGRWYYWRSAKLPIPQAQVITHSANMHMIPASPEIEEDLKSVRRGDVVLLSGYLVEVRAKDGWMWRSSLRRDDTGGGSCEVVWVDHVSIEEESRRPS